MSRGLMRCLAIALCFLPTAAIAANDDPKELERVLARVRSEPMIFVLARGEANVCGRGCTEWIAAEGQFDEGAARRFRDVLAGLPNRKPPIFFNSDGGLVGPALQIGLILREHRMRTGVARTVPEGCRLGIPIGDACRQLMQSKSEQQAKLYFGGARCGSACVYAMLGGSTRHLDSVATLRIHSSVGREVDKVENSLRRYVMAMGIDPAIVDAAARIPSRTFRALSRGDIERFGIETRGVYETPWFAYHGAAGEFLLLKSVTSPTEEADDAYQTRSIGVACNPFPPSLRLIYHQELAGEEAHAPLKIQANVAGSLINLATLNPQKNFLEASFDLELRHLQNAIASGTLDFTEIYSHEAIIKSSRVAKFSTWGLSAHMATLVSKCTSKNN